MRRLDRILVFDRGRIAEDGSHGELLGLNGGLYRRLYKRQASGLLRAEQRVIG